MTATAPTTTERTCATCHYVISAEGANERCKAYWAGANPVLTKTALGNKDKCGSSRKNWRAPVTKAEKQADAAQCAAILEAGGLTAKLLQFLTK